MNGLCHFCLKTNQKLFPIKGIIRCYRCIGKVKPPKTAKPGNLLPFEDLPQITDEQRRKEQFQRAEQHMKKIKEMEEQRDSLTLIDGHSE